MHRRTTIIVAVAATAILTVGGFSIAQAQGGDDDSNETDTPISGADLDQASAAALASTGGGRVSGTEVGDEESYYEVEVTLDDGSEVDVQLDEQFQVVSASADAEEAGDSD